MLRLLSLAVVLVFAVVAVSATAPDTPPNETAVGTSTGQANPMCLLQTLTLKGLTLTQTGRADGNAIAGFVSNHFTYSCSCDSDFVSTIVYPITTDSGSSAEVTFNGVAVNSRTNTPPNGISNDGTATTDGQSLSPIVGSQGTNPLTFVTGTNTIVVGVGCNGNADPNCYYQYTITCNKAPGQGSSVIGDPQFVGLRGQNYQVHGVSGEVYNIVSDSELQYNSRFVFLSEGKCPVLNGRKQKSCWSHPGSYLGELGLKTRAGDKIQLVSGSAKDGFASVQVNGKELEQGETVLLADDLGSVSRNNTHMAAVQIGNWDFVFENSDMFVNQKVRVLDARKLRAHGLLGQTWRETTYPNAVKYIQGEVDDYVIRDSQLFGDNFVFNSFN